jgi:hypothetical protein
MDGELDNPHAPDTKDYNYFNAKPFQSVTCGQPMTEGRHYWEVEFTSDGSDDGEEDSGAPVVLVGAVRPDQDCGKDVDVSSTAHFGICSDDITVTVSLFGNATHVALLEDVDHGEEFINQQGDRIGCMLDLDAGWLRFYRNGVRLGQEYASGVTGPLLRYVEAQTGGVAGDAGGPRR